MRIRLEYSRGKEAMYLSHLDVMRTFGRSIRRAGIAVGYTAGFNPHAKMVFGLPLQVGVTSQSEYFDIEADGDILCLREMAGRLNNSLPAGFEILGARALTAKENAMSVITHAEYEMRVGYEPGAGEAAGTLHADLAAAVEAFMQPGPRMAIKEKHGSGNGTGGRPGQRERPDKRGRPGGRGAAPARAIDLAPLVRSLEARGDALVMTVAAGAVNNVKPDLVLESLNALRNDQIKTCDRIETSGDANLGDAGAGGARFIRKSLHRMALYTERGGVLYKPSDDLICE